MNTDEAYLMGVFIGGGVFRDDDSFVIKLPFRSWGDYSKNPERAGRIAQDILRGFKGKVKAVYGVNIEYQATENQWEILVEDNDPIKKALERYGVSPSGELRGNANLNGIVASLIDDNFKHHFVAGLADVIGSVSPSHRRFTDKYPTISFEIPGFNFSFVCTLCRLLYSINCIPDQIVWNHPNIHCTLNPYNKQWKKGFKMRILLDQYSEFGHFAFSTKALVSRERKKSREEKQKATPCSEKRINLTPSTVHIDENCKLFPTDIAGGHYVHSKHFCAVLGCEHAPYSALCPILDNADLLGKYIIPFPLLYKDSIANVQKRLKGSAILKDRQYSRFRLRLGTLLSKNRENRGELLYGDGSATGYPLEKVMQAVAYVLADKSELRGKRIQGNYVDLLEKKYKQNKDEYVTISRPDILTPIILEKNDKAAMVAAVNPKVYSKLIVRDKNNRYKIGVREITEEDFYEQ